MNKLKSTPKRWGWWAGKLNGRIFILELGVAVDSVSLATFSKHFTNYLNRIKTSVYQSVAVADHFIVNCILQVIKARILLDRSMAMPASFIPIHELANEIHIINAFCREAEVQMTPRKFNFASYNSNITPFFIGS